MVIFGRLRSSDVNRSNPEILFIQVMQFVTLIVPYLMSLSSFRLLVRSYNGKGMVSFTMPWQQLLQPFSDIQISPPCEITLLMRRDFVVARIEASQDGSPYVYVTFNDPKEYKPDKPNMSPFGPNVTSMEDFMKNMPKVITNIGFMGPGLTDSPTIKFSMHEYQDMGIKVGDKVYIEIQKADTSGV